jgi:hypothetical protein
VIAELRAWAWRLINIWAYTFSVVLACWQIDESARPGQQYADPILPCLYVGYLAAAFIERVSWLALILWRRR